MDDKRGARLKQLGALATSGSYIADAALAIAVLVPDAPEGYMDGARATQDRLLMLDRAVQMNESCEKAFFYRAMLHKRLGNDRQASRDFRKSADLNPRNLDSLREVRLYEMRKGRASTAPPSSSAPRRRPRTRCRRPAAP